MLVNKGQAVTKNRLAVYWIFIIAIFIGGSLCLSIYLALNPSDRVKVTTSQFPPDTMFISFVSESNGILQNMDWYPRSELMLPFTMRPSESVWSSLEFNETPKMIDWDAYVKWRWGEKYGLVTRDRDGNWRITWFLPKDVPIKRHWFIIGNGEAHFDLNKGTTTHFSQEKLMELSLDQFPFLEEQ